MKNEHGLTQQQEAFAQTLVKGGTQSAAYRSAYRVARMTAKQVHEEASKLAAHPKVRQRMASLQAAAADRSILKLEDVLEATRRIMLSTPAGVIDAETGRVKLPHELDAATAAAVSAFEIDELGRIKYKFWDKNASIERAAKILGAFERDNEQKKAPLVGRVELVALQPADGRVGHDDEDAAG